MGIYNSKEYLNKILSLILYTIRQERGNIMAKDYSVFDIVGPNMIGPSSSHTAGAARLGKSASKIAGKPVKEVNFLLHGSFAETYKGHGTDKALVGGILGFDPDDARIKYSFELAKEQGVKFEFIKTNLGENVHPNTVKILMTDCDDINWEVLGSSIGGGLVEIYEINGNKVKITGEYPTIITCHDDIPGTVSKVSTLFYDNDINIAHMTLVRSQKGKDATMTFEVDNNVSEELIAAIKAVEGVNRVILINSLGGN